MVGDDVPMRGYSSSSYGDAFADVYDDWYRDLGDIDTTIAFLSDIARGGSVLELGVGTGRLAVPLRAGVASVTGIDSSQKMLDRLAFNDELGTVTGVLGDMVDDLPTARFDLIVAAYNTVFNLLTVERQQQCFRQVASRLTDDGSFVVEAFVPQPHTGSQVSVRSLTSDRLVLSASVHSAADQLADGQFVELTEAGGVRLRPWSIRWAEPEQLDEMATHSGLALQQRWADYDRSTFDQSSERHVSVYVRQPAGVPSTGTSTVTAT
ncbi:MAG: putative methyltransferase [Ilumatobacteraceae bacterium]|nr:putative methyltransferase [Ilumatobacteraceae bacterium]